MTSSQDSRILQCSSAPLYFESGRASKAERLVFSWDLANTIGILGESGAGKTNLLRRLAGLDDTYASDITMNGHSVHTSKCTLNPSVYVGADTPLFEHLSLRQNLELVMSMSHWNKQSSAGLKAQFGFKDCISVGFEEVLELCEIEHVLDTPAALLSSGEGQRGMLARALLCGKPILLLDEAFSAMDWALRNRLHWRLKALCMRTGRALIIVSHSLKELGVMSDTLVHINAGLLVKEAPTLEYLPEFQQDEISFFAALQVKHLHDDLKHHLSTFILAGSDTQIITKLNREAAHTTRLLLDANSLVLGKQKDLQSSMLNTLAGDVIAIHAKGSVIRVSVEVEGQTLVAQISEKSFSDMALSIGETIYVYFKAT
jgi:molybdate transport system ATP-binding protein